MAGNDTAALIVALEAKVDKFEKAMNDAGNIADKAAKRIEGRFAAANAVVADRLSTFAANASSQLGTVGSVLTALGPIGLAVAASVGTLALAYSAVSDKVDVFAEKAKRLKEAADTAGLTITQLRLLGQAGSKVGLDFDQTEAFVERLSVAFDQLRQGGGPLFDQLLRIDAGLVREVAGAKNTAEAIDILARAYARLNDQAQRNALTAAIAGRRNLVAGRLLDSVNNGGGLQGLEQAAVDAGKKIDEELVQRVAKLRQEIEEIKKRTDNIWGSTFAVSVLESQKASAEFWERIASAMQKAVQYNSAAGSQASQASPFGRRFRGADQPYVAGQEPSLLTADALLKIGQTRMPQVPATPSAAVASPAPEQANETRSTAANLEIMKRWTSLLGEAITPAEQLKLKILELDAAQEKNFQDLQNGIKFEDVRARALEAFKLAQAQVILSTRERLGLATEEEISSTRLRELEALRAKGFVKGAEEMAMAQRLVARDAKAAADALAVRGAALPGLKQLELDGASLQKQLDSLATSSVNNIGSALTDITMGTVSASDGFRKLGEQVARSIIEMTIRMAILVPLARSLQTALGGAGLTEQSGIGDLPKIFGNLFGGARAGGGPVDPGRAYLVGENGPELFMPRTPGAIVANGSMGGGAQVHFNVINNAGVEVQGGGARQRSDGGVEVDVTIERMVNKKISSGAFDRANGSRYRQSPAPTRR